MTVAIPKFRRRREARPEEIVAAALQVFEERGFAAARLEDIALRAGITKGTIFLYFPTKEALLEAALEASQLPLVGETDRRLDDILIPPYGKSFERFGEAWLAVVYASGTARRTKIVMAEAANFPELAKRFHAGIVQRVHGLFRRIITAGIAAGEFRPVDIETTIWLLLGSLVHVANWNHSIGPVVGDLIDERRYVALWAEMAERLLRAEPSAAGAAP